MANIFTLENFTEFSEKINIDELYEKKRQVDQNKLELFKKIIDTSKYILGRLIVEVEVLVPYVELN